MTTPAPLHTHFLNLLTQLIRQPAVVGAEHSFFRVLQRELEERGATVSWYEGLLVAQGKQPDSLYLSAHVDRHGLMCTGPNEFQYAAFVAGARSDLLGNSVSEELLHKIVGRFPDHAVYAYDPWSGMYRGNGKIQNAYICPIRNNLIFELNGLEHAVAGMPVAFTDKLTVNEDSIAGQLDNVLTVAALIYLYELGFEGTAFFTAQEEAGKSWRYLLEWFRRFGESTNQLIVVDTSPFPDFEQASQWHLALRNKDANATFNANLTQQVESILTAEGYSFVYKDEWVENKNKTIVEQGGKPHSIGATELGRIILGSNGLVDGTTLQIPTSGYHTLEETAPIKSVEAFLHVLTTLSTKLLSQ